MSGVLYGVGVGPGDPELMTLKAARLIGAARVVAYPALAGAPSFARSIAAGLIPAGCREIVVDVPMTLERAPAQAAYDRAAAEIGAVLAAGEDVVCLCEGDPFFYGSFMYLYERLAGEFDIEIVPGVSSLTACAAALRRPLAARNDALAIIPAPLPDDRIMALLEAADAAAIMKVGRHLGRIRDLLAGAGLLGSAGYLERVGLPGERVTRLAEVEDDAAPYFSMVLIYKGAEDWIADHPIPSIAEAVR
jgi:precorrin-2/cobalt-factor-2 C20-methyltransferase